MGIDRRRIRQRARTETAAYITWCWCETHGWDHTVPDVAAAIGQPARLVWKAVKERRWENRFRVTDRKAERMAERAPDLTQTDLQRLIR